MMKIIFIIFIFFIFITLCSCAFLSQSNDLKSSENGNINSTDGTIPKIFQLHDVPHNPRKQQGTDCAPDSLRMILNYRGKNVNEQDIVRQLTGRGFGGGTTFGQMQEIAVKSYSLPSFLIHNCDLDTIKSAILNKFPPIIGYRASGKYYHAVVGVGYDDDRRMMFVHDPNILGIRKMRYSDLGGVSDDGTQSLSVLIILPEGSTSDDLVQGLAKYVAKEKIAKLMVFAMLPTHEKTDQNAK